MQFCNFRMALFVFFSRIHHWSLIILFLFVVLTCLSPGFAALVPANGTVSALLILYFHLSCRCCFSFPFLPRLLCSQIWLFVVQLSGMVVDPRGGSVEVQCGAAFQEGMLHPHWRLGAHTVQELSCACEEHVASALAMPELFLESYSNSYLPVFSFQSLFMGFFTALQHPHIFLNLVFITSVPALSLIVWMYILLLIKHDSCTCFLLDLIWFVYGSNFKFLTQV